MNAKTQTVVGWFNDDQRSDLLRYNKPDGTWATRLADGGGGWSGNSGTLDDGRTIVTGSFDQDERTDIILYKSSTGSTSVRLATGAGQWTGSQSSGSWPSGLSITPAYFDGEANAN